MTLIDMHVHACPTANILTDMRLFEHGDINEYLRALDRRMSDFGVLRSLVYLLDERVVSTIKTAPERLVPALMIDFRNPNAMEILEKAQGAGMKGIKLLTYEQEITASDYPAIQRILESAQRHDMFVTVCSTFGSKKLYKHDAIAIVSYLLSDGFTAPIIMAHGGGARARETMLLMDDASNLYLDTSFTTTYWKGSIVIDELAYTIQRFPDRCFFGSDAPYVPWHQAFSDAEELLTKLPSDIRQKVLHLNAAAFLQRWIHD